MRFLDLGVAAAVGLVGLASLYAISPQVFDSASRQSLSGARATDGLVQAVMTKGLVWFQDAPSQDLCAYLGSISNSSSQFSAKVDSVPCGTGPPSGVLANMTLRLGSRTVSIWDWSAERA